ncbi:DUF6011 domain-containing protein [Streptomyces sp. NPDC017529]|uniref:DUF6011 domain-containing protein n=1 Tax=Streptomyces sp. NPDC017529 TaxID=3365000 RepID=UPI003791361C
MTSRPAQDALPDTTAGGRTRIYCRRCRRELHDATSRTRGMGPECDPLTRVQRYPTGADQDPIPGT